MLLTGLKRTDNIKEVKRFEGLEVDQPGQQIYLEGQRDQTEP
ncbi:hypothetical protein SSCH_1410003 [Syntrophaceticus schinkii]|uniref:Uncharacterized protein n=1 Tax=Syntrophaceticus schinkii TaxID=499207 RepID=A0A0B7MK49_9FIRM|nr:hypothetical protein SSCH_1410003 [Syntrophaceticus schinkii]